MQPLPLVNHLAVSTKILRFSGAEDASFRVLMLFMNAQTVLGLMVIHNIHRLITTTATFKHLVST